MTRNPKQTESVRIGDTEIILADCLQWMEKTAAENPAGLFDTILTDPPYRLSNDGITCQSGKMVSVNKGKWDKSEGHALDHEFNLSWLSLCQKLLKKDGTIWVSATSHAAFSIGHAMKALGFKILNDIVWAKRNPPPNLSCRYFTHSHEHLIWAAKNVRSRHTFHYAAMKAENLGKQMRSVWEFLPPSKSEKTFGKHPTQKPLALMRRCIAASTPSEGSVFDPFMGSGTTGIAALVEKRSFVGCEMEKTYFALAEKRLRDAFSNSLKSESETLTLGIDFSPLPTARPTSRLVHG
jgi:site-specific DNA-methyltransferase (adenine-specific)